MISGLLLDAADETFLECSHSGLQAIEQEVGTGLRRLLRLQGMICDFGPAHLPLSSKDLTNCSFLRILGPVLDGLELGIIEKQFTLFSSEHQSQSLYPSK
jgi:hypothetical protein